MKILVQQGDPTQVYCISERVRFVEDGSNKTDEVDLYYAYERQIEGTKELKGFDLIDNIYHKATRGKKVTTFH